MAHGDQQDPSGTKSHAFGTPAELGFLAERVTGIEPALSAWESEPSGAFTRAELRNLLSASHREIPVLTGVNGTLMARRTWPEPGRWPVRPSAFQAGHIPSWRGSCECYALSPVAAVSRWWLRLLSSLLSAALSRAGGLARQG
jgi:hypothetical protein